MFEKYLFNHLNNYIFYINSSLSALLEQLKQSNPELMNIISQKNGVFELDDSTKIDDGGGGTNSSTENYNGDGINTTNSEGAFIIYGSLGGGWNLERISTLCISTHSTDIEYDNIIDIPEVSVNIG